MISIIIPVYNVEKYLRRCLDSLLQQNYKDFEVILINDGSRDSSPEICHEYEAKDRRFKYIEKKNEGAGMARNCGLAHAIGEFIGFMDSDDYCDPFMYEVLHELITEHNADLVYCNNTDEKHAGVKKDTYTVYDDEAVNHVIIGEIGTLPEAKEDVLFGTSTWRGLYRKKIIDSSDLRFKSEREIGSEDLLFNLEYLCHCKRVVYSDSVPYHHCINSDSVTHSLGHFKYENELRLNHTIKGLMEKQGIIGWAQPLSRMFVKRIRCAIINYAKACNVSNFKEIYNEIRDMLTDKEVHEIISDYPGNKLPIKKRVFFYAMKYKRVVSCIFLGKN